MVKHIVLWSYKPELTQEQRHEAGETIRQKLEDVGRQVPGVVSLEVRTNGLSSSNREVALLSVFESREALEAYQIHPAHVEAGKYVRAMTCDRACMDFEE